ncbi:MAG TPA: carbohydrate ABC transporter permease [Acidimicrobiales bacterium]|nr:carbohydrate ABC transporter permease [Acidimicrobiales bacterium]
MSVTSWTARSATRPASRALKIASRVLEAILFFAAVFFIVVPLVWLVMLAFAKGFNFPSLKPTSLTLQWWHTVLHSPGLLHSVFLSVTITPVVVALSSVVCLPAAYALGRYDFPGKRIVLLSIFSINAFPRISLYIAMIPMLFALNLMGTVIGVVIVQLIGTVLFMTWIPATGFASVPDALVDAARDAGANKYQVFWRVLLPLARPSIAVAAVLSFLAAFDEAQGTFLVGAPNYLTMPIRMYSLVLDYPVQFAAVFAVVLSIPSVALLILIRKHLFAGTNAAMHLR